MNVLSLFDGMSCGQIALDQLGVTVDNYYAAEIKDIAIKVTMDNYPDTIQLGSVTEIEGKDLPEIDLLIGGSPCQNLSMAMAKEHRKGLEGDKSSLFYEWYRIWKEVNPTFFLLENVGGMPKKDKEIITELLGVKPIRINSRTVSAQLRDRLYWTNIPIVSDPLTGMFDHLLEHVITEGYTNRHQARALLVSGSRPVTTPVTTPVKMYHRYVTTGTLTLIFKDVIHAKACADHYNLHFKGMSAADIDIAIEALDIDVSVYDGVRHFNQTELERLQTVPEGYTKCLTRNQAANVLGDGWTVDVIKHLFEGLLMFE